MGHKVLMLLDCGHTSLDTKHREGTAFPLLYWCEQCQQPMGVEAWVSSAPEKDRRGRI